MERGQQCREQGQERCEHRPPRCQYCRSLLNKIPRELQEELFTRALQDELAAKSKSMLVEARDDIGMVDLETREFFSVR